ncbi:PAAR domain-containing protein [Burkholderia sp. LMG 13014]|uniref:PAAR domain-containing protein n=1 Tax=Burkholderia sp. LMG 13014 TaxID=2709306 RepID=UPI0019626B62|nr:PAAR domain-containing protein [Burkholderia sp. LMG 13014]
MKRSYLKIGDRSSAGGTVVEGIPLMTHHGTELTFIGAAVTCPACRSTGQIVAKGPRWPGDLMGKHAALEGDVCSCKCYPPPVMIASQSDMTMSFESHELASMGFGPSGNVLADEATGEHWIRFALNDKGSCEGLRCRAHFSDGSVEDGVFDSENRIHFTRPNASTCQKVEVVLDHSQDVAGSVTGSLLRAMVG